MSFIEGNFLLDRHRVQEIITLAHQMVYRYMSTNILRSELLFYAPDYFINQLKLYPADDLPTGISYTGGRLTLWGVDVQLGYEPTLILFCPHNVPSSQSPVTAITGFGRSKMAVLSRY